MGKDNKVIGGIDLESLATYVVDVFDQANTNNVIENLGTRGKMVKEAIAELRFRINSDGQKTILSGDQVGEHITEIVPREITWMEGRSGQQPTNFNE
jgi:hypothetical protein